MIKAKYFLSLQDRQRPAREPHALCMQIMPDHKDSPKGRFTLHGIHNYHKGKKLDWQLCGKMLWKNKEKVVGDDGSLPRADDLLHNIYLCGEHRLVYQKKLMEILKNFH